MLMIPFNVVMTARLSGYIDPQALPAVIEKLRARHALLGVRVEIDGNDDAWFIQDNVPEILVEVRERGTGDQWIETAGEQAMISFDPDKGPLIRFVLLHSNDRADLVICCHHLICDGISLTYLLRDILTHLADPHRKVDVLPEPPVLSRETVPTAPSMNAVARAVMRLINRRWARKNIRFGWDHMKKLHQVFWERNRGARTVTSEMSADNTSVLVHRCREEAVTVNTALWTAFMMAQRDVQDDGEPYRGCAGMAVNIRNMLKRPVQESFGFYAASLTVKLPTPGEKPFWDIARDYHDRISRAMEKNDPFKMLTSEYIHPTLLDSLYFSKYGLIKSRISMKLLKKMRWDKTSYGYSITNVGRVPIPLTYGNLGIECIYGPFFYSDVNEKTVGVITTGDTITFMLTYNSQVIPDDKVKRIMEMFDHYITQSLKR